MRQANALPSRPDRTVCRETQSGGSEAAGSDGSARGREGSRESGAPTMERLATGRLFSPGQRQGPDQIAAGRVRGLLAAASWVAFRVGSRHSGSMPVTTTSINAALARYARSFHQMAGAGHQVASPLGAWLLLALA